MKTCPICNSEIEHNFEICWNCNYSFTEKKQIDFLDANAGKRNLECLRCGIPLIFGGNYKFYEGTRFGFVSIWTTLFLNRESFDLYVCPKCGKVEFYTPVTSKLTDGS
ncbi:hypothetical protein [Natronoflexus pectinivorans]|uniref:Uncharacterized protein n=1 Tax=Natronoflexus pectinivorans TaxID=682526 RepID=A0A4R2GMU7_9BACT|nr:hypothetical protein [Natronoflexus pectinivorans]TCO10595.1 hypothetical protein EV194_101225 [Natronoflexus pectinivorans]